MFKKGCLLLGSLVLLTACQGNQSSNQSEPLHVTEVKQTVDDKQRNLNGKQIAKRLVNIANRIPGVNDATVIVAGNYAVVGIDVDKNLDRTKVGDIKSSVAEALKKDPYGANAAVTSDPDIIQRLKNMGKQMRQGKPLSGIASELAAIVERLVPEIPNNVRPNEQEDNPQPTQQNQEKHQAK
ncbi:putative lipoprotein YlaJ [Pullulanibacillus camelliae]|uniref:Putative lipoprotein YlaJ n=1 Tax=Pullulanibacillus camelliae TaxID=1707096 RepID=A0A8J2YH62_9BACL|nr:YhcN/YlaJ family sporulation lipoprotein [Pullulanibacillus camelliae]GGE41005.1 putative lipoprotein YlaJ [Pullulanibacillus camelliae]